CPLSDVDGLVCSDRGTCRGAASGTDAECVCEADYYGAACGVYCTAAACESSLGLANAQCNATTGACECQDNNAGHFAGAVCDDCATLYWGPECDRACPCNGRGSCDRYTATCACFESSNGHLASRAATDTSLQRVLASRAATDTSLSARTTMQDTLPVLRAMTARRCTGALSVTVCARATGVAAATGTQQRVLASRAATDTSLAHRALSARDGYIGVLCEVLNTEFSVAGSATPGDLTAAAGAELVGSSATAPSVLFRDSAFGVLYSGATALAAFASEGWGNGTLAYLGEAQVDGNAIGSIGVLNATHIVVRTAPGNANLTLSSFAVRRGTDVWIRNVTATALNGGASVQRTRSVVRNRKMGVLATPDGENITLSAFDLATGTMAAITVNASTDTSTVFIQHSVSNVPGLAVTVDGAATFVGFGNVTDSLSSAPRSVVVLATQRTLAALAPAASWWFTIYTIDAESGDVLASRSSTELVGATAPCNHTSGTVQCPYVTRCVSSDELSVLVCAASVYASDNTLLIALPLENVTGGAPLLLEVPEGGNVTAAAFDVLDSCVLLGMAPFTTSTATSVYRVRVTTQALTLVSQLRFALAGAAYPVVQQMLVNSSSRSLFASLMAASSSSLGASSASVQHINLFGIWKVDPRVVDRDGGTLVTYIGTGFIASPTPMCVLTDDTGATAEAPALFANDSTVYCNATLSVAADSICDTATLNLRYANRTTATTLVTMLRPLSATVVSAATETRGGIEVPSHSLQDVASFITVIGYGFVAGATAAACRHESSDGTTVYFTAPNATFVNSTLVICHQPEGVAPTPPGSVLRYSHDGFVYSPTSVPFVVVGEFSGVVVSFASGLTSSAIRAAEISLVPPILVQTTDALKNLLGLFDATSLTARCSLVLPLLSADFSGVQAAVVDQDSLQHITANGVALFDNITLIKPAAGSLALYCYVTANLFSVGEVTVTVAPGTPSQMLIVSPQAAWLSGVLTTLVLDPSPEITLSDAAGNVISDLDSLPSSIDLAYVNANPLTNEDGTTTSTSGSVLTGASVAADGTYTFSGVSVQSPFGQVVQLRFTADGIAQSLTITLTQESCTPSEYGVAGTFSCAPCPADAVCDGSTTVAAFPGFWRSSAASVVMYECTPGDACPTALTCAAAYTGAVCGSCAPGFGRSGTSCAACASAAANWGVTFAIVAALGVLVYALSVHTVAFTAIEDVAAGLAERVHEDSGVVSVVAKLVVSHLQVVALIPARALSLPQW
ncbi:transmembrane protein, putative, partial [Bodo saltans]